MTSMGRKPQVVNCPGGRFLSSGSLLDPAASNEAVVIDGSQISIGSACARVAGKVKPAKGKVKVKAAWAACRGVPGKVRLVAAVFPECRAMSGTVQARKAKIRKSFSASRSMCGDGLLDRDAGEQCEAGTTCAAGEHCSACLCVPEGTTVTTTTTLPQVSFSAEIQPVLAATCAVPACHTGRFAQEHLDLGPAKAYAAIVNADSSQCPAVKRVLPGDPAASYLMWKLAGQGPCFVGARMPSTGTISDAQVESIRTWILQGARDN